MLFLVVVSATPNPSKEPPLLVANPKKMCLLLEFTDGNQVVDSSYDFSVVDSNSLAFVFKYAPEVANELHVSSEFSFEAATLSRRETWMVCDNEVSSHCYVKYMNLMVLYAF